MKSRSRCLKVLATAVALGCLITYAPAQQREYRASNWQIQQLITRIQTRSDAFRRGLDLSLTRLPSTAAGDENINQRVQNYDAALDRLEDRFRRRQDVTSEVEEVLNNASFINVFVNRHQLNYQAENNWRMLRTDLTTLARYLNVSWNWSTPGQLACLTGTYRLEPSRSDDTRRIEETATRGLSANEAERVRNLIRRQLEPPDALAIDQRRTTITMASSRAPQVTFTADRRTRVDETRQGRSVRITAGIYGDQLIINRIGERGRDFYVSFDPIENCGALRVTRRLTIPGVSRQITVQSTYDKTSEIAQLDLFRGRERPGDVVSGDYVIPTGTRLTAVLNNDLSTNRSREGDRFTLTVRSPSRFDGATIEGRVINIDRSGSVSGRSELALQFDRIRLRNGASHEFDGYLEAVRTPGGQTLRVDNEGRVAEQRSQTRRTVERAGIGAAIGAVIGAIIEGGQGALIGAAIGAGAGAGSIFIQGRQDLELEAGTELTIQAVTPRVEASIR